jgi:hypothetical protein
MSARRVISAAAGYILVVVLERALSIVTMPITTRLLAPVDFAQLIAINNITSLLNNFVCLFLARALPAVLSAQPNDGARRDAATTIMIGTVLLGAVTLAAMWPLAGWIGQLIGQPGSFPALLRLALVATVVILLGQTMLATARSLERHRLAIVVQSTALVLQTVVVLSLLLLVREGVASLFWAALAGGIVVIAGYLPQLSRWFLGRPSVRHLRRAAQVSSHLLALNLGALVTLNSAGLILNWAGRPEEAAAFNIATGAAALGMLAAYSFDNVWTPYVLHRRADVELPAIARRVFNLHSAGFLLGAALGALFAHEAVDRLLRIVRLRQQFRARHPARWAPASFCLDRPCDRGGVSRCGNASCADLRRVWPDRRDGIGVRDDDRADAGRLPRRPADRLPVGETGRDLGVRLRAGGNGSLSTTGLDDGRHQDRRSRRSRRYGDCNPNGEFRPIAPIRSARSGKRAGFFSKTFSLAHFKPRGIALRWLAIYAPDRLTPTASKIPPAQWRDMSIIQDCSPHEIWRAPQRDIPQPDMQFLKCYRSESFSSQQPR